jgi:rare lipoprotein A
MYGLTAAHKTLPFGTKLSVVNLDNGKTVTVTVNDRGPFVRDRVLDLSYGAAKKIGMIGAGSADIKATILKTSEKYPSAALP